MFNGGLAKLAKLWTFLRIDASQATYIKRIKASGLFDRTFYRKTNPGMNILGRWMPERHFVVFGEPNGLRPSKSFSPHAYIRQNSDVPEDTKDPFLHFITKGQFQSPITNDPLIQKQNLKIEAPCVLPSAKNAWAQNRDSCTCLLRRSLG